MNDRLQQKPNAGKEQIISEKMTKLLSVFALLICCTAFPLCIYEWVSGVALVLLFAYVVLVIRRPGAVFGILLPAVVIVLITQSFGIASLCMSLIIGVGALAYLLVSAKWGVVTLLIPGIASPLAYVLLHDGVTSLLALAVIPSAVLLAIATGRKTPRTRAILYAQVGLIAAIFGIAYLMLQGGSAAAGISIGEYLRGGVNAVCIAARDTAYQAFLEIPDMDLAMVEQVFSQFDDSVMADLAAQITNLLPAMLCVLCAIVAYEAQYFVLGVCYNTGRREYLTEESRTFTMSIPAAVIYLACTVLGLFLQEITLFQAVVSSLSLILLPGLALLGWVSISASLRRAKGGMRLIMILLFSSLACCSSLSIFPLLAAYGAYGVIMSAVEKKLLDKIKSQGGPHDPDDFRD